MAHDTRDRIVTAATDEFARHGIAGARVERIAKSARTSKERVYAHFRAKEDLYRYVAATELGAMAEAVPFDPADLPGYAVRIHDHIVEHPQRLRLMKWGELELPGPGSGSGAEDPFLVTVKGKVDQVRRAQKAGLIDAEWDPWDVLVLVSQIATSGATQADALPAGRNRTAFLKARRQAVQHAVERLFPVSTHWHS